MSIRSALLCFFCGFLFVASSGCGTDHALWRGVKTADSESGGNALGEAGVSIAPLDPSYFSAQVLPKLQNSCNGCHANPASDYAKASALVKSGSASESKLYQRVSGTNHGAIWPKGSKENETLRRWIEGYVAAATPSGGDSTADQPADENENQPASGSPLNEEYFNTRVKKRIASGCVKCHKNPAPDYQVAASKVTPYTPGASELYLRAIGEFESPVSGKKHPEVWSLNQMNAEYLWRWIMGADGQFK